MKYNRKKLIDRANAKIKELDNTIKTSKAKTKQEWDDYKNRLIIATELQIKDLKEWDAKPGNYFPSFTPGNYSSSFTKVYAPLIGLRPSMDETRQAELRRFVAQLELSDEVEIVLESQYDMQLLNCITGV